MSRDPQHDRLHELLEALANESLTSEQHAELQALLRDQPEAQQRYLAFMDLHVGLRTSVVGGKARAAGRLDPPDRPDTPAVRALPLTKLATKRLAAMVSIAALVLVMIAGVLVLQRKDQPRIAAVEPVRLKQSAGTEFFEQAVPPVGGSLEYQREYALTSGMVELRFPN